MFKNKTKTKDKQLTNKNPNLQSYNIYTTPENTHKIIKFIWRSQKYES